MTVLLEYIDRLLQFPQMFNIPINIYFTISYYGGIMLNALNDPLSGIIGGSLDFIS